MICLKPCPLGKWVWKKIPSKKIYLSWTNGQEVFRRMHEVPKPIHEPISLVHRGPTNWPNWCIVKVKQASQILLAQIFLEHQFLLFYWQFSCKRNHFPVFEIQLGEIMSQQDLWIQGKLHINKDSTAVSKSWQGFDQGRGSTAVYGLYTKTKYVW